MQPEQRKEDLSESEDDSDYVPPTDADHDSEGSDNGDERDAKRVKTSSQLTAEEEAEKKRAREELWASFQASVSQPSSSTSRPTQPKIVKIEKRYRYAGEEVIEVVEVPEDSEEAKKWPLWKPPVTDEDDSTKERADVGVSASGVTTNEQPTSTPSPSEPVASPSSKPTPAPTPTSDKPSKRPGPRKPKTKLAPLPEPAKAKKLTTLDKSAMDWKAHVSTAPDTALRDELEANRRGGGYLEKVEFLQRVGERKDETFEANKATKRRRG